MLKSSQMQSELRVLVLRLGGTVETLDLRLIEAQKGHLDYPEFLELLPEDEIGRRAVRSLTLGIVEAHFEEQKTLQGSSWSFNPTILSPRIRDHASGQSIARKEYVLLYRLVGVGMTFIAEARGPPRRAGWATRYCFPGPGDCS